MWIANDTRSLTASVCTPNAVEWDGSNWIPIPRGDRKLKKISVGGQAQIMGVDANGQIYQWTCLTSECSFTIRQARRSLKNVTNASLGYGGYTWAIDTNDDIFHSANNHEPFNQIGGKLKQISVGGFDHVWGVNANGEIYKRNGSNWERVPGNLKQVSVGTDGAAWGRDANDDVFKWDGSDWIKTGDRKLKKISVGNGDHVWGLNANGQVVKWNTEAVRLTYESGMSPEEERSVLDAHNNERQLYSPFGVQPLQWSPELAKIAADWARTQVGAIPPKHNQSKSNPLAPGESIGEGIVWGGLDTGMSVGERLITNGFIAGEKPHYHYELDDGNGARRTPGCTTPGTNICGHFLNVIWKNTTHVGCGLAENSKRKGWLVCNYYPAGSLWGQKPY